MQTPEQIAEGLSEAQREAVMSASETIGGQMVLWHAHRGTMKSLYRKGICCEPCWRGNAVETPLGLSVREILITKEARRGHD
ncbi:hypothetical protein [Caenibius sp. WL]|uniref:hypothetical protein n=1 Tax=Caenibius sp. WL TaxID=2872646 RepID=UPI001C99B5F4|nr:hypothetical protein [Caenibius sp. WL]QZP06843.1 hypothetical protein K5X80_08885 [Caenibius sp. WL]